MFGKLFDFHLLKKRLVSIHFKAAKTSTDMVSTLDRSILCIVDKVQSCFLGFAWLGRFVALTEELRNRYQKNHYHNFRHAVDVTHNVFLFLELCEAKEFLSDMEVMALMVAAMFHDVDHPGVNNNFLIQSRDPLAVLYNHKSGRSQI